MAKAKKFGTFGGVFTPSILTILGVIMYLRLPWIVGQGGLWRTLGIIVVAHIISFTTGLSVASIATDKKVKAGGNYYIISRSLGLSIGGTLGYALFAGLTASIGLYVIGFTESLLPYLGLEHNLHNIRMVGLISLTAVAVVAFISTSLAIKTQYLILTAVGMSLISIFLAHSSFRPQQPLFDPLPNGEPLMVLFGIFFPAVTGFTAGVQMSGDLRDPKRAIPIGTMAAIGVGFLVYLGLAIFWAFSINRDLLINDTNVLIKVAWNSAPVVAGIWGATLSSAMGSILGAPRILQAMSHDGITPSFFARGHGKTNEPRNALIFTYLLSVAVIWIGELNLIARIVSIFFITTYGVLNLSFALENWASTDFRPSFRIPTWVGVLGAATAFLVMIELDVVALIAASIILSTIFVILKRRQLVLESGDAWQGVWSSIVQTGLTKLTTKLVTERNWRPNIILFSGGTNVRPHLVKMAEWLAYKRGMVSNFDLIENPDTRVLFNRTTLLAGDDSLQFPGFFSRRIECKDIYDGMDHITRVYGFSGIEPNTVLMGWARNTANPARFVELLHQMQQQDYNILLLKYHARRAFGECRSIDIWWRGGSNNAALALSLLKFIQNHEDWQEATARILIVIDQSALANKVFRNMNHILSEHRLNAQVKVVNNAIEKRPFPEILKTESSATDLVMMGIPEFTQPAREDFIMNIERLIVPLGSVLLLSASSRFKPYIIGIEREEAPERQIKQPETLEELPPLTLPFHGVLANYFSDFYQRVESSLHELQSGYLDEILREERDFLDAIENLIRTRFEVLEKRAGEPLPRFRKVAAQQQRDFFYQAQRILSHHKNERVSRQETELQQALEFALQRWNEIQQAFPEKVVISREQELKTEPPFTSSSIEAQLQSARRKKMKFPFRHLLAHQIKAITATTLQEQLARVSLGSYSTVTDLQKLFKRVLDGFSSFIESEGVDREALNRTCQELLGEMERIRQEDERHWQQFTLPLMKNVRISINTLGQELQRGPSYRYLKKKYRISKPFLERLNRIPEIPGLWSKNIQLLTEFALMELHLINFQNRLKTIVSKMRQEADLSIKNYLLDPALKMKQILTQWDEGTIPESVHLSLNMSVNDLLDAEALVEGLDEDIRPALEDIPEVVDILSEDSYQHLDERQFEGVEVLSLLLRRLVNRKVATRVLDPLKEKTTQLARDVKTSLDTLNDLARLLRFQISARREAQEDESESLLERGDDFLRSSLQRLQEEEKNIRNMQARFRQFLGECLSSLSEELNPYQISIASPVQGFSIQQQEGKKVLRHLRATQAKIQLSYDRLLEGLVYKGGLPGMRQAGLLPAPVSIRSEFRNPLHQFMAAILPLPPDASHLPFFYRQLFLGKQPVGAEFWIPRPSQERQAQQAIEKFRAGLGAALLVSGDPLSGKTSLSLRIAHKHFLRNKIHSLHPPEGGCSDAQVLRQKLITLLGGGDDLHSLLEALNDEHVLIFHDLELWWMRHPEGSPALKVIEDVIGTFSRKFFIMATVNWDSFRLMSSSNALAELFSESILCSPLSAKEIATAIYLRHNSGGLPIFINGTRLLELSAYRRARVFNAFHRYAEGNIGAAFHAWICHIHKTTSGDLRLEKPHRPNLALLEFSDEFSWVLVLQIFLHKQLTRARLLKISGLEEDKTFQILESLLRFRAVIESPGGVLQINPFLQPFLLHKLKQMEWL